MITPHILKTRLPRTWPIFFARHGNFTPVQMQAIPPILDGHNTLIIAATAAGKTEAAIAPLLERHVLGTPSPQTPTLTILYICPTRALVRDLYERLALPLAALGVNLSMKSGDTGPVSALNPPTVLITTPESTDSLLTRAPRLFIGLRALVLDEIHLFDNGVRGDHLRCLLGRIAHIRAYDRAQTGGDFVPIPRIALSATVPDPMGVAARYLVENEDGRDGQTTGGPQIVQVSGQRLLRARILPLGGLEDLTVALGLARRGEITVDAYGGLRKALIFCNSRNEVEQVAAYLRGNLGYEAAIFVHYSNLDPAMRREVEDGFAAAPVALCVCTSTLELGIDIGSVDHVVLLGPPPSLTSFLQRIGRGGRRAEVTRVLCLARSDLEDVRFRALLTLSIEVDPHIHNEAAYHFRPSVLVQQTFSILKQSPTGGIRLADVARIVPEAERRAFAAKPGFYGDFDETVRRLFAHLTQIDFLRPGRMGEWRSGPALDELVDAHEIYSNIGADPLAAVVVDAFSGKVLAQTERIRQEGETLTLGGRLMEVVWRDRYRMGVRAVDGAQTDENLRFATAPFAVPLDVSQGVAAFLGLAPGQCALIHDEAGAWLFHFWGDVYGELLEGLLEAILDREHAPFLATRRNEHCLHLTHSLPHLPAWDATAARRQLQTLIARLEPVLELGRFHSLLPPELADPAVIDQIDLPRFRQLYEAATLITPGGDLRTRLLGLL